MDEIEQIAQRMIPGAKFLVKHWVRNPHANEKSFTITSATLEGVDYFGAFKISVTATQDSTGIQ